MLIVLLIMILIVLYLLSIMPKLRSNPDINKLKGWFFAHRGLHDKGFIAPENSLKAFELAVNNNYGIELDVQLTKDNVLIVLHDRNILRLCGVNKKVRETNYSELIRYSILSSNEKIPTLQEVLTLINGSVPVIIELKIPKYVDKTCRALANELMHYKGVYCIESFNPLGLLWYKKHYPNVMRGQLASDFFKDKDKDKGSKVQYFILKHLLLNFITKPDFISYNHIYKKGLSFTICRRLYRITTFAWTIQSQEELNDCKKYFDVFIFDGFMP